MNSQEATYKLMVEGGIKVLYKGSWVDQIPLDSDEITIGVMDPDNNIYPDINLRQYRLEGGDPYISRRHARFLRVEDKYCIEDICRNNSTSIDKKSEIINGVKRDLQPGMRIFISESVVFRFTTGESLKDEKTEESKAAEPAGNPDPEKETPAVEKNEEMPTAQKEMPAPLFYMEVGGQTALFFKPRNLFTHIIELNPSEWAKDQDGCRALQIGRRSTEDIIYPDIDLWKFYFNDGDEYIARRHARIFESEGKLYFQDLSGKGSTWINEKTEENRLLKSAENEAKAEIVDGMKLMISDSTLFVVHKQ